MAEEIALDQRDLQAAHFDGHRSVVPADRMLREAGFSLTYILKDQEIADEVVRVMRSRGMRVLDIGCGYWLAARLNILGDRADINQGLSRMTLRVESGLCSLLRPRSRALDKPWTVRGPSNGFLITAEYGNHGNATAG